MKKIVFTGPESTGKTTMAERLASFMNVPYVREIARDYILALNRPYSYEDVINISLLQMAEEEKIKSINPPVLICDTDLATIQIWCDDKYKKSESWITSAFLDRLPDFYFLCRPDFPWEFDTLREDPLRREQLYDVYKSFFIHHKIRFVELGGSVEERIKIVLGHI